MFNMFVVLVTLVILLIQLFTDSEW